MKYCSQKLKIPNRVVRPLIRKATDPSVTKLRLARQAKLYDGMKTLAWKHAWVSVTESRPPRPGRTSSRRVHHRDRLFRTRKRERARRTSKRPSCQPRTTSNAHASSLPALCCRNWSKDVNVLVSPDVVFTLKTTPVSLSVSSSASILPYYQHLTRPISVVTVYFTTKGTLRRNGPRG